MGLFNSLLIIGGLCLFEAVSSLDNAVVNADVLVTMGKKWRRWCLIWGIFFSVFLVRGVLPWAIIWMANPSLGPWKALTSTFSSDPLVAQTIHQSGTHGAPLAC